MAISPTETKIKQYEKDIKDKMAMFTPEYDMYISSKEIFEKQSYWDDLDQALLYE